MQEGPPDSKMKWQWTAKEGEASEEEMQERFPKGPQSGAFWCRKLGLHPLTSPSVIPEVPTGKWHSNDPMPSEKGESVLKVCSDEAWTM